MNQIYTGTIHLGGGFKWLLLNHQSIGGSRYICSLEQDRSSIQTSIPDLPPPWDKLLRIFSLSILSHIKECNAIKLIQIWDETPGITSSFKVCYKWSQSIFSNLNVKHLIEMPNSVWTSTQTKTHQTYKIIYLSILCVPYLTLEYSEPGIYPRDKVGDTLDRVLTQRGTQSHTHKLWTV